MKDPPNKKQEKITENQHRRLRLRNVLHSEEFCTICFNENIELGSLENHALITSCDINFAPKTVDVLQFVFGDKMPNIFVSNYICKTCKEAAVNAFTFIQNTIHTAEALNHHLDQLESRIDDLSNMMDSTEDTSIFANTVIVLNDLITTSRAIDYDDDIASQESITEANHKPRSKRNGYFVCEYCKKVFRAKQGLAYHISKIHTKSSRKHVNRNPRIKRYIRKFECPDCERDDCAHKKYLDYYKKQRLAGKKIVKCADCDYFCYLKPYLIAHVNKVHLKIFSFKCEICKKPLHSRLAYKVHKKTFHSEYHTCPYCEKKFMFTRNLEAHTEECKIVLRKFQCTVCSFRSDSKEKMTSHKKRHVKKYPSNLCNKVLATAGGLRIHKEMHESNTRMKQSYNYYCHICNENFSTQTQRVAHLNTHNSSDTAKCVSCDIVFKSRQEFIKHVTKWHPNPNLAPRVINRNRLQCNHCCYSTVTEICLEAHINRYHLKIAPYSCIECGKKFTNPQKLGLHKKTHNAVKSHQCDMCGNYFCGPTALKKHVRLHTGERPYPCEICGEKFLSAGIKNVHILRKHTSKTVSCPLCDNLFHSLSLMRSHFKKAHWKLKGEPFDVRKVEGLKESDYDLFRDRRLITF